MPEAVIIDACRTPRGRKKCAFREVLPMDLLVKVLRAIVERTGIDSSEVDDVIMGCVTQTSDQGMNIARGAWLASGMSMDVPGVTLNRFCGSGQQAVNFAAMAVMSGQQDLVIAGGVESMTRVPLLTDLGEMSEELTNRYDLVPQGICAEMIAEQWKLERKDVDEFAYTSQMRAKTAQEAGRFDASLVPVAGLDSDDNEIVLDKDEHPRPQTTVERLGELKPAFQEGGVVTAGNSSGIVDGASCVLVASAEKAKELGLEPRAKIVATTVVGSEPVIMLTGPIPATPKVLKKAGMEKSDIDLVEINEAFASVPLAWSRELGWELDNVNVNGGAIALGHPLGATGGMLVGTVLDELERRDQNVGLITMCIGYGMATATIIDRNV